MSEDQIPPGCDKCCLGPRLYTPDDLQYAPHITVRRGFREVAVRCSCDRGRWLAAKDRERMAAQPERRKCKLEQVDYRMSAAGERE